jgi:hypothetical protein
MKGWGLSDGKGRKARFEGGGLADHNPYDRPSPLCKWSAYLPSQVISYNHNFFS